MSRKGVARVLGLVLLPAVLWAWGVWFAIYLLAWFATYLLALIGR